LTKPLHVSVWLRFYAWLFAAAGLVFVAAPTPFTRLINLGVYFLPGGLGPLPGGLGPLPGGGPLPLEHHPFWLGLSGSMMAVLCLTAYALSRDPRISLGWQVLLLSKAVSTALFVTFAATGRNSLVLVGAVVDGAIFLHLLSLWEQAREETEDVWAPREPASGPFFEVWFAKLNDPRTRDALWVRYTRTRSSIGGSATPGGGSATPGKETAAVWYVLFDHARGEILQGKSEGPMPSHESSLATFSLAGRCGEAQWDLHWEPMGVPVFRFVPGILSAAGLAGSEYVVPAPLARFEGRFTAQGREYRFLDAKGSIGHLWGRRMADNWWWAHAVFEGVEGTSVFEILSAQLRIGPSLSPRLTCAHLWLRGRHYRSVGIWSALRNRCRRHGDVWTFRVKFSGLSVEGECAPQGLPQPPSSLFLHPSSLLGPLAELEYESPEGRRLRCRNSKTGAMRLRLGWPEGGVSQLSVEDTAAVEYVGTVP